MENHNLLKARDTAKSIYFGRSGIVGVGFGYKTIEDEVTDEISLVILVKEKLPLSALSSSTAVPPIILNVTTDIVQVGNLRVSPPGVAAQDRTDKWRPAPGGVSIGHYKITAGTLGAVVKEKVTGDPLILTNNHVAANSNDAVIGDSVLQPGPYDGGSVGDGIGKLHRFVEIDFGQMENGDCPLAETYAALGNFLASLFKSSHMVKIMQVKPQAINLVDAAVVKPNNEVDIDEEILELGFVTGIERADLGMSVMKSGRTTGFTTGKVTLIGATVEVSYGGGKSAQFENQILTGPMSQGGDSGSLLVSEENRKAVGLLFAGSSQVTIYNPIDEVLNGLYITF